MEKLKKLLDRIFIDGLTGMAQGLFATLIVGTIIQQIGSLIGGNVGDMIFVLGKMAATFTGAGIGVGVAYRFKESPLVVLSAATAGMVGAFAAKLLAGSVLVDGAMVFAGPGEPLGAFLAAYVGIEFGHLVSGKAKVDILVTPIVTITAGSAVGLLVGPPISEFITAASNCCSSCRKTGKIQNNPKCRGTNRKCQNHSHQNRDNNSHQKRLLL